MKKVLEMREKRAKAWDAAKAFLDARADGGVLSAEDNATYEKMVADVDAMARQIAIEEDRVARDAAMAEPTSKPLTGKPTDGSTKPTRPRATGEYREDFGRAMRGIRTAQTLLSGGVYIQRIGEPTASYAVTAYVNRTGKAQLLTAEDTTSLLAVSVKHGVYYATAFPPLLDCYIGNCMTFPSFSVVSTSRQNGNQFYITVNYPLQKRRELEIYFSVTPDVVETTRPKVSAVTVSGSTICITTDVPISSRQKVVFTLGSYSRLCFLSPQASPLEVPNFTAVFEPDYVTDDQPEMAVGYLVTGLVNTAIAYPETTQEEKLSLTITYTCSLTATQVGDVPV